MGELLKGIVSEVINDVGWVIHPLCASMSSSVKWDKSTYLIEPGTKSIKVHFYFYHLLLSISLV